MKFTNIILLLTFYLLNTNTIMSLPTCPQCDTHEEGSSWSDDIICYKKWKDTIRCSPTYEEDGMGPCLEKYWKKCQTCESKYEQTKLKERARFDKRTRYKLNRFKTICSSYMNDSFSCQFIKKYVTERYDELYNTTIDNLENNC